MKFKLNTSPLTRAFLIGSLALSVAACHEDHEDALLESDDTVVTPPPAPTNTAPTVDSTSVDTVEEGSAYSYTFAASDAEGDALTMSASTLPAWLTFDAATGALTGTPATADVGDHAVTLDVSDGSLSASQSFTITVTASVVVGNTPPTITSAAITSGTVDVAYSYTLTATDADGDTLDMSSITLPTWGAFDASTGVLSGTPDLADSQDVELMVSDGTDAVTQAFTIVVSEAVELGPELLINGNFENGAEAWTLPGDDTDTVVTEGDNTFFMVDVLAAGNPWDVNLSQGMALDPDSNYVLSFRAKASVARSIVTGLGLNYDPWTNVVETVAITTEWETYTVMITTTGFGDDDNRVIFDLGAEAGAVSLDDVSVTLETAGDGGDTGGDLGPELLVNGDFTGGGADWLLPGDDTDTVVTEGDNTFFMVDVLAAGNPWDVNLSQVMTLVADTDYVLSFRAKASVARSIVTGLGLNYDPWTNIVETVAITTEWETYTLMINTAGFGDDNNRVIFDLGAEAGVVSLDDVSVKSQASTGGDTGGDTGSNISGGSLIIDITAGIDFEGTESEQATWETFENGDPSAALEFVANPSLVGNTTSSVAKLTPLAAEPCCGQFAGAVTHTVQSFALSASNAIVKIWVYKDKISPVGIKFEKFNGDGYGSAGELRATNTLINEWEQLTIDFSAQIGHPENDAITGIVVFPDMVDGRTTDTVTFFDEITFTENGTGGDTGGEPGVELIVNGDFEDGATAWTGADGLVVTDGDNSFFEVDVLAAGNPWDVNLSNVIALAPDTAYDISYRAKASVARTILVGLGLNYDPFTNFVDTVALTTEWATYTATITTTGFGDDNNRLIFDLGAEVGVVSIDDVSVSTSSGGGDTGGDDTGGGDTGGALATVDFEAGGAGAGYTWTTFENGDNPEVQIVANPDSSGANTSSTVAQFTALQAGNPWAGAETAHGDFGPLTLDSTNSIIRIMVYKTVISDVGIKFAIASGGAQGEIKVANTLTNQWEELTFDFSGNIGLAESIDIDQLIVFPDFDLDGRTADTVSYFDNITFGN